MSLNQIPQSFRLIFETSDLLYASPATVSRCGVVRVSEDVVPTDALKKAWLKRLNLAVEAKALFDGFVQLVVKPILELVRQSLCNCIFPVTSSYLFQVT